MRWFIKLSYNGSGLCGWQIQPGAKSVQGLLERALSMLLHSDIKITGAGRTDAGVNATGYIAHFDAGDIPDAKNLAYKLNAILPSQIVIHSIERAEPDFHARFDACLREYRYYLHRVKDPFVDGHSLLCAYPGLDFEKMNIAAQTLLGQHDFSCFEKTGTDSKTPICTVSKAVWEPYSPEQAAWEPTGEDGEPRYWRFTICANRFLRNMVRAVVGTLIEVGRGKRSVENFASLILPPMPAGEYTEDRQHGNGQKTSARSLAGESVPGKALFLSRIEYPV